MAWKRDVRVQREQRGGVADVLEVEDPDLFVLAPGGQAGAVVGPGAGADNVVVG